MPVAFAGGLTEEDKRSYFIVIIKKKKKIPVSLLNILIIDQGSSERSRAIRYIVTKRVCESNVMQY